MKSTKQSIDLRLAAVEFATPYPSIKMVDGRGTGRDEIAAQGGEVSAFYRKCLPNTGSNLAYLVVPQPAGGLDPTYEAGDRSQYLC